jgi:hypothetical protein
MAKISVQTQNSAVDALIADWEAKAEADSDEYVARLNAHDPDAMFYLGTSHAYGKLAKQLRHAVYGLSADEKLTRAMVESVKRGDTQDQMMQRLLPMMLNMEEKRAAKR